MKKRLILGLLSVTALAATGLYAANAQHPATMLVLDASGSMWGQIDGKPKIAIAREAVGEMLDGWKGGDLGLMAYGHRRKGDCGDIEVLQAIGPNTAAGIRRQVNALNPKGMTPITEAVRMAANQLRYTEQKATVILVSDGEETCNADPCALGKELEAAGVDFTAHVIGFDIQKGSKADRQLQCLAANTGGRYVHARNAAELDKALGDVASTTPAKPAVVADGRPTKGCRLYDRDNYQGESVLLGAHGYDNEMPPGWDNRVRSLKCSMESGLYLYNDKDREGDYLMIDNGAEMTGLGAGASSYIYFGDTLTEEEAADEQPQASVAPRRQPRTTVVDEKVRRQGERQQQRTEDAVDRATDRAVDKATDKVLNKLFGG